jgi:replicative DNA helicase
MKLSAPIYILKQQAKALSQRQSLRLHEALDQVATREGFTAWSHLASAWHRTDSSRSLYDQLHPGELLLLGSRPGQGKTLLSIGLAIEAMTRGHRAAFFTLEFTETEVEALFKVAGRSQQDFKGKWLLDTSEDMSAGYITERLDSEPPRTLIVVDYLQLLDQRRDKPSLDQQVRELKEHARRCQAIVICLSQIAREFTPSSRSIPSLPDVRLPNPIDLTVFDKACFIHEGKMKLHSTSASGA